MKSTIKSKNRDRALDSVFGQMDCFRLPTKGTTFQPLGPPAGLAAARHQCIQNGTHLAKKYRGGVQNAPKLAIRVQNLNSGLNGTKFIYIL